jgi:hypothetical protein
MIIHNSIGKDRNKILSLCRSFVDRGLSSTVIEILTTVGSVGLRWNDWENPEVALFLRKLLREEVDAALFKRDDRAAHLATTGEVTRKGHEPKIMVLAILINYHIDARFRQIAQRSIDYGT